MTQLTPTAIPQRRHTDPPWLWISVFLASVLIHSFGLGVLSRLMTEQQASEVGTAPIPVELIAMRPESKIRKFVPSPVVTNPKRSGQKSGTRSQKLRGKGQKKFPTSAQKPSSLPKNTLKKIPKPKPLPPPYPKNKPSPSPRKPAPKSTPSPKPSPLSQGGSLVATLSHVMLPSPARDIPDSQAQPQKFKKDLPQNLFPGTKNLRHRDFHVYLVIDKKGKVDLIHSHLMNPSSDTKEARQVMSIFQDWTFQPAIQNNQPVDGELVVDLKIAPRLIKSK